MSALDPVNDATPTPATVAERASMQAFLNCYLLEVGGRVSPASEAPVDPDADRVAVIDLTAQGVTIYAPLRYQSPTRCHRFESFHYRAGAETLPLDFHTLVALCVKELSLGGGGDADELVHRATLSRRAVERFVRARAGDDTTDPDATFREAEQSLVFGHLVHPTPKSRQGMGDDADALAPETESSFRLEYARVDPNLVVDRSARDQSAADWIRADLRDAGETVPETDVLIPLHPRQATLLREDPAVRERVRAGDISFEGELGRRFHPTTSVRTLYAPDAPFMVKASLPVRITNSLRTNRRDELDRGVAVAELLDAGLADDLRDRFPHFRLVRDPASLTVDLGDGESGFETVLRENAFPDDPAGVSPVVALCQDAASGERDSRLGRLVRRIADREGRSEPTVARDWYRRYLDRSLRPMLWLYLEQGIGVEAHQQNAVLALDDDGYPGTFYYRDNQGYYLPESQRATVETQLPNAADRLGTLCPDDVADERLRYYVVLNNAFGVCNALGRAGVADERDLLDALRETLADCRKFDRPSSSFLDDLLDEPRLPCKANLLTRFRDLDELEGSLENQSVYADIDNPLAR